MQWIAVGHIDPSYTMMQNNQEPYMKPTSLENHDRGISYSQEFYRFCRSKALTLP